MKNIYLIFGLCILFLLISCKQKTLINEITSTQQICKLNNSPTLFLYPMLNEDNLEFFNNTIYKLYVNNDYFGEFKGNRFNHTFLNLSFGDRIDTIVKGKDKNCETYYEHIYFDIGCKQIQYINPLSKCYIQPTIFLREPGFLNKLNQVVKVNNLNNEILLEISYRGRFDYIGCKRSSDRIMYELLIFDNFNELEKSYRNLYREDFRFKFKKYSNLERVERYSLLIRLLNFNNKVNDTLTCTLYDEDYVINRYEPKLQIYNYDLTDVGFPNQKFNITLIIN